MMPDWRTFDAAAVRRPRMTPADLTRYHETLRASRRVVAVEAGTYNGIARRRGCVFELDDSSEYDPVDPSCGWLRKVHERPFYDGAEWYQVDWWPEYKFWVEGLGRRCPGHPDQITTAKFKAWFGESKVVDETGAPFVVFKGAHGPDFPAFYRRHSVGILTTGCPAKADQMAMRTFRSPTEWGPLDPDRRGQRVIPLFARVERPYMWNPSRWCAWSRFGANWIALQDAQRRDLEAANYDGIISHVRPFFVVVVFDPRQLKSAIGNCGSFDDSANICE